MRYLHHSDLITSFFQMCHPTDQGHLITHKQCTEPCRRFPPRCSRNHPCNKLCKEDCGECLVRVEDTCLPCGHYVFSPTCDSVRDDSSRKKLSEICQEKVTHTFTACGHKCETTCANASSQHPICPELCNVMLECGHPCDNKCVLARMVNTHANKNARGRYFVATFAEESAMVQSPANPATRNVRYHVYIQNVWVNAAIS